MKNEDHRETEKHVYEHPVTKFSSTTKNQNSKKFFDDANENNSFIDKLDISNIEVKDIKLENPIRKRIFSEKKTSKIKNLVTPQSNNILDKLETLQNKSFYCDNQYEKQQQHITCNNEAPLFSCFDDKERKNEELYESTIPKKNKGTERYINVRQSGTHFKIEANGYDDLHLTKSGVKFNSGKK